MSIDTLPEQTSDDYTPDVRNYLAHGVQLVDERIDAEQQRIIDLEQQKVTAQQRLEELKLSRTQLLALVGKEHSREPGEQELPTQVCGCGRIAVIYPVLGPVHEVNGTHLPAMETCQMPPLGFPESGRAGGPEAGA